MHTLLYYSHGEIGQNNNIAPPPSRSRHELADLTARYTAFSQEQ